MEEYLECIICYDEIDKNLADFILDICDTCKYVVHISCYEEYLKINNRLNNTDINDKCLICHKYNNNYNNNYNNIIINNHVIEVNNPIRIHKKYCKNIIIAIALILLLIIIIVYIILIIT
jgi:hypothetical protein